MPDGRHRSDQQKRRRHAHNRLIPHPHALQHGNCGTQHAYPGNRVAQNIDSVHKEVNCQDCGCAQKKQSPAHGTATHEIGMRLHIAVQGQPQGGKKWLITPHRFGIADYAHQPHDAEHQHDRNRKQPQQSHIPVQEGPPEPLVLAALIAEQHRQFGQDSHHLAECHEHQRAPQKPIGTAVSERV